MKYAGPIIDFRVRLNTPQMMEAAGISDLPQLLSGDDYKGSVEPLSKLIAIMDIEAIVLAVVQGSDVETTYDWRVPNEHVAEIVAEYPERLVGFGGVDPNKGMAAVREIEHCVKDLGLLGISIEPSMHQSPANERLYYPLYAKCQELKVIMNITTGPVGGSPDSIIADASPLVIDEVARDFPELKIVVSHGGYPFVTDMIAVASRHENVYFDCSSNEDMPGSEAYVHAANRLIPNKILYASSSPFSDFKKRLTLYDEWQLEPDVRRKVMCDNASKLLGVTVHEI